MHTGAGATTPTHTNTHSRGGRDCTILPRAGMLRRKHASVSSHSAIVISKTPGVVTTFACVEAKETSGVLIPVPLRESLLGRCSENMAMKSTLFQGKRSHECPFNQVALPQAHASLYPVLFYRVNGSVSPCVLPLKATSLLPWPPGSTFMPGSLPL